MRSSLFVPGCFFLASFLLRAEPKIVFSNGPSILTGDRAGITIKGVTPESKIRLNAFRSGEKEKQVTPVFHAFADFLASAEGAINVDNQAPISGTFTGADPRGLFWSGYRETGHTPPPSGQIDFELESSGSVIATATLTVRASNPDVQLTKIQTPALTGYFAAPKDASHLPVVILLHGSEGGSLDTARQDAALYASHGFAAFSLIYFAWPYSRIPEVPQAFDNLPVERIAAARDWLAARPEADVNRIALRGISKGSEFALLAAVRYPWVRAVAACVPTSLVWGSFGTGKQVGELHSGFSFAGKPIPNIPYSDYAPVEQGKITLTTRHRIDRGSATQQAVDAALIPIEKSGARFYLVGGKEDAVWPSSEMAQELELRMQKAGRQNDVLVQTFPHAGHYLCGTGSDPARPASGDASSGGGSATVTEHFAGVVWERTLQFLNEALLPLPPASDKD